MTIIDGKLTIGAAKEMNGKMYTTLTIRDVKAITEFVEVLIPCEDFMQAIGGLAKVPCAVEVRNLSCVGKVRERQPLIFEVPNNTYSGHREILAKLAKEACLDGWEPVMYFGSQDSFYYEDGKRFARTHMQRWVDMNNG